MATLNKNLLNEALSLPSDLRSQLIDILIQSLNLPPQSEIDTLWLEEAERRGKAVKKGEVLPIPGESVFEEIRKRYNK
jgi:putative addiction module component (TIGR02574 family)